MMHNTIHVHYLYNPLVISATFISFANIQLMIIIYAIWFGNELTKFQFLSDFEVYISAPEYGLFTVPREYIK